ncbi:MAG: rod shape-determining protein MreD [Kiritimatiellia bacterium]
MTTAVSMIFLVIGAGVMQMLFPAPAAFGGAQFPFLACVVIYYALNRSTALALAAAFTAGFLHDTLSEIPLGYSAVCLGIIGWLMGLTRDLVVTESFITQVFFGAVGAMAFTFGLYALLAGADLVQCGFGRLFLKMIGSGIFGAVSAPPVFLAGAGLDRLLGNIETRKTLEDVE